MTNKVNYSTSVARKNACLLHRLNKTRGDASSGRQRPGIFSQVGRSSLSLSRKSELPCHGSVRYRLNLLIPQSRRPSRGFQRSRQCPKLVVVASGRCRRRCGGTGRFDFFL